MNTITTRIIVPFILLHFGVNANAQTPVYSGSGYYLINESGKKYTETHFDYLGKESSDLFLAAYRGQFGYIGDRGHWAINPQFDIAFSFNGNFAVASTNNEFYLINKQGDYIDTLERLQKPQIFRGVLAASIKGKQNAVIDFNGDVKLRSKNKVLLAEISGIAEWFRKEKKLDIYTTSGSRSDLYKVQDKIEFDSVFVSTGGFLIGLKYEQEIEKATIFNHVGNPIWTGKTEGIDISQVRKANDSWILIPKKYHEYPKVISWNLIEYYYPYEDLISLHGGKENVGLSISHLQPNSEFAKIVGINRWVHYTGNDNDLNQIINEVAIGDGRRTLIKYNDKWHIHDKWKTITELDYKHIHPKGSYRYMFFASNSDEPMRDKKWAFVNHEYKVKTEELYQPVGNESRDFEMVYYEPRNPHNWEHELIPAYKADSLVYLNDYGRVVWAIEKQQPTSLIDFLVHDLRFPAKDFKTIDKTMKLNRNDLQLILKKDNDGLEVLFANNTKNDVPVEVQDGSFMIKIQKQDYNGQWIPYLNMVGSDCGNSYYMKDILPKSYTTSKINMLEGSVSLKLRAVVYVNETETLVSNPVSMTVNLAQAWTENIPFNLLSEEN
ncbi:MAG: WG repeat-containing protein [Bacteroidia bacterium]